MKSQRHALILRLITEQKIATQEQLLAALADEGMVVAQATVSRDITQLKLRKNGAFYEIEPEISQGKAANLRMILRSSIESVGGAGHTVCVRCEVGMAQSVCVAIDALAPPGILGSLAGEDTIFLLCKTEQDMQKIQEEIRQYATTFNH
ncbi:MAG: ArgR family transcriptional regulator [Oscillospiraceae bacterium]|nr:ArgR family transcriptional regulator [Oscillospiraceae bacterium]